MNDADAVSEMRARFSWLGECLAAADVVEACASLAGYREGRAFEILDLSARDDNPCWLPQRAFEDVAELCANPRNADSLVALIVRLRRSSVQRQAYVVAER